MHRYLLQAAEVASRGSKLRQYRVGAVGVRSDGAVVRSYNGTSTHVCGAMHAEARLSRKLDWGATVYVARVSRETGEFAMARPCAGCERCLRLKGVRKIIYSIGPDEYGIMEFK
jgi:hypothetical protein